MITLDHALLSAITGAGDSTTRDEYKVTTPLGGGSYTREQRTTDNESCRRDVKAACHSANPSLWNLVGREGAAASQCFLDNFPKCPP